MAYELERVKEMAE